MAALNYTTSGSGVFTEEITLELYAGAPIDGETWQDGQSTDGYPGNLGGFQASNTGGTGAAHGLKLVCGRITTAMVNAETLTIKRGSATGPEVHIKSISLSDNSQDGKLTATFSGGVITFTEAGTSEVPATLWMILA